VIIDELLRSPARISLGGMPEADALTEVGALQEAGLVDVRTDAIGGRVELLFDLRSALQFRMADTAVLVVTGVTKLEIDRRAAGTVSRGTPYVMSSVPSIDGDWLDFRVVCLGGWSVHVRGRGAEFFVGNVLDLPAAPPNYSEDDDDTIRSGVQSWESDLDADWATFIEPASSSFGS
jgi:hypothetical protein